MQSSYSIEFNVLVERLDTSHAVYLRMEFITVFALGPESIIQGQLL